MRLAVIVATCLGCLLAAPAGALGEASIPISSLVAHRGEFPGFTGAKPEVEWATGVSRFVKSVMHETGHEARREIASLKQEGFVEGVQELLPSSKGEALSRALVFRSAGVVEHVLQSNLAEGIKAQGHVSIKRFSMVAIPGSEGFSATEAHHPGGASNVLFTAGRCFLLVGDSLRSGNANQISAGPIAAVASLYPRVKEACG